MRKHLILISIISLALAAVLIFLLWNYDIIPGSASTEHNSLNQVMKVLAIIAMVFFSIIITSLVYSFLFFRRRRGDLSDGPPIKGYSRLELAWTVIPLVIVIGLAIYGGIVLQDITRTGASQSELQVNVTAFRFGWQFSYPQYGNVQSFQLGLAANRETVFNIQSRDVVHAFWVPEFGPSQDAVPGLTTILRYTPDKEGQFLVQCNELCGYGHSTMLAPVTVMSANDFETWVKQQQQPSPTPTPTPAPSPGASATPTPSATPSPGTAGGVINVTAKNIQFDTNTITVKAGSNVTIQFNNQDTSIPHNIAFYTDSTAAKPIFIGNIITGPATTTYTFTAPSTPGNYFFRCDVHPTSMTGTFVVQ